MTKVDLVDRVYEKLGSCTKEQAFDLVEITLETLKESIVKEGRVKIVGFGRFVVREKAARKGRNPLTGEPLTITPRKVLTFIASPILKNKVNDGG